MALRQSILLTCPHEDCGASLELVREPLTDAVDCTSCGRPIPVAVYRFCPRCAGALAERDDNGKGRLVCASCGFIVYRNPLPGVAVVITEGHRILLGRRRSSLFDGMWCIPCGYVEIDEDVHEAARREFAEETGLEVEVGEVMLVHSNFQVPYRPVLGVWFRGNVVGGEMAPGDDVRELQFFPFDAPPAELAFEGDELVIDMLRREAR